MNVLVTGGSGFVGTNLVAYYSDLGCNVVNIDVVPPRNPAYERFWKKLDIRDGSGLRRFMRDFSPNLIMHMAARTDLDGSSLCAYNANTDGVKEVIEAASELPALDRVIFASSMLVCALGYHPKNDSDYCPTNLYGESKVIGEQYVREFATGRFPWTIVRPTSLWGPWFDMPYKRFFEAVEKRIYMHPKGRKIYRSYGFILNSINQLSNIASCKNSEFVDKKLFYLADYEPIELLDWSNLISARFDVPSPREVPLGLLKCFALAGDFLKIMGLRNPPLSSFRLNNLLTEAVFDLTALEKVAGSNPYDVEMGVEMTVDWMRGSARNV